MADRTYTEREVFDYKMGRHLSDRDIVAASPSRYRYVPGSMEASDNIWKRCEVCGLFICVNNGYADRKPRTPRFKGLVVCTDCDPRHPEDRWEQDSPRILHPRRMRVIAMALIAKKLSSKICLSGKKKCNCIHCVARKLNV